MSDKEGMTKVGKEAVEVWRRHFEEVLNEGQDSLRRFSMRGRILENSMSQRGWR